MESLAYDLWNMLSKKDWFVRYNLCLSFAWSYQLDFRLEISVSFDLSKILFTED